MSDLFKDAFTGRIISDIKLTDDYQGRKCYEFSFYGTHKKLQVYTEDGAASV